MISDEQAGLQLRGSMKRSAASKVFLIAAVCWASVAQPLRGAASAPQSGQGAASAGNLVADLDRGWRFRQVAAAGTKEGEWLPATVPGDVHLASLPTEIPDPFFRDNEKQLQWIEKASWEYELDFEAGAELLKRANVELVFDGLDAAAEVDVTGRMWSADNMFRTWRVPVKGHLRAGKNVLHIVFPSPIDAAAAVAARDPWQPKTKT